MTTWKPRRPCSLKRTPKTLKKELYLCNFLIFK